jgi:Concanavalin A-like lectin/glucanases superfamily
MPNNGGGGGFSHTYNVPLVIAANTTVTMLTGTSISSVHCSASGFSGYWSMIRKTAVACVQTLFLIAWCQIAVAQSNIIGGGVFGDAKKIGVATFQGPGDVASGALAWGSCARVYDAALASTSTSLCDLVSSSAPTVVLCTLRGSSTGFVDLSAYCAGSLTPAATCAAATGAVCNVSKVYDQTGNSNHFTNVTAASQPVLTFSALNSLPGMTGTNGASTAITTTTSISATQPYTLIAVAKRPNNTGGAAGVFGQNGSGLVDLGYTASVNTATFTNQTNSATGTASDNAFHDLIGVSAAGGTTLNVDGSSAGTGTALGNLTSFPMRAGRSANPAASLSGTWMEFGVWPSAVTASTMSTNIHSATSGYNFWWPGFLRYR